MIPRYWGRVLKALHAIKYNNKQLNLSKVSREINTGKFTCLKERAWVHELEMLKSIEVCSWDGL